jgi:hypothetical protein
MLKNIYQWHFLLQAKAHDAPTNPCSCASKVLEESTAACNLAMYDELDETQRTTEGLRLEHTGMRTKG